MIDSFPREDLPPVRHEQVRDLLVREATTPPRLAPRRFRPRPVALVVPAAALAVVLVVAVAALGLRMAGHPGRTQPAATAATLPAPGVPPLVATTGSLIAVTSGTARFDLITTAGKAPGTVLGSAPVPGGAVEALALNPGGTLLATVAADGSVRLWNVSNPHRITVSQVLWEVANKPAGRSPMVAFSADGRTLVANASGERVFIWSLQGGRFEPTGAVNAGPGVLATALAPSGNVIAVGTSSRVRLWSLGTGPERVTAAPTGSFPSHASSGGLTLVFTADGSELDAFAEWGSYGWDVTRPAHPRQKVELDLETQPGLAFFPADSRRVLELHDDGTVYLTRFDSANGSESDLVAVGKAGPGRRAAGFAPSGHIVVVTVDPAGAGQVVLVDSSGGAVLGTLTLPAG